MEKTTILIVDDDEMQREMFKSILESKFPNIRTITKNNGEDGLAEIITNQNVSLVITDYDMHKMNGAELAYEIRKIGKKIPIILSSGHAKNLPAIETAPVDAFLPKPFGTSDFKKILSAVLNNAEIPY